jgi:protoheme IX farnesyltransferase
MLNGSEMKANPTLQPTLRRYISLTKPGVLFGNVLTGAAGFLLAAGHIRHYDLLLFVATIIGMTCIIAAACALNNVLDRDIDKVMTRTRKRAVASGAIAPVPATIFAVVLGLIGVAILALRTNWLVFGVGVAGFVIYVWLYGEFSKRRSPHGTLAGSISGAMPVLAGYCAVSGRIDAGAVAVFLILFFWQFPEFYSIAIYRREEYAAAHIPVMTVARGVSSTKRQIFVYTMLFVLSVLALTPLGYTGYVYAVVMAAAGGYFVWYTWQGLHAADDNAWARKTFHYSLNILMLLSLMLAVGALLP